MYGRFGLSNIEMLCLEHNFLFNKLESYDIQLLTTTTNDELTRKRFDIDT